jgi:gamma-glutamyltranspeptidase/glutathione hydrolase
MFFAFLVLLQGFPAIAGFEPVYAGRGMVVSAEPNATLAGLQVLQQGGNAFDAAVAVGFALAVTYPAAGNLGGGGFLVALTAAGKTIALDFREKAPDAATRDMYLGEKDEIIPQLSTDSFLAVGVPGTVHGLMRILEDYGTLPRSDVLAPAIRLAEEGFPVAYSLSRSLKQKETLEKLTRFPSTANVFYPGGQPPEFGGILRQTDLAHTLTAIREDGAAAFYEGAIAQLIANHMRNNGGIITQEDLWAYSSKYREPFTFSHKNYQIITHPVPSSGGVTLAQILQLLEPFPLRKMGYHSAKYVHLITEAERLAFADRNHFLGDPDFVEVPDRALISEHYLQKRRTMIPQNKAGNSMGVKHGHIEPCETTHYCVVDSRRNVVAVTYTLNDSYGMGAVVEGAGFLLNNEMDDFSAKPGRPNLYGLIGAEANAIAPGKRMLSSMTPTIVLKDNRFDFTMGSPGGPMIITTSLQIFLNITEMGMNIREAIDARRFHHQWLPDIIEYEPFAFSPDTILKLRTMGYTMKEKESIGVAAGIQATEDGLLAGYADGRGSGQALGY